MDEYVGKVKTLRIKMGDRILIYRANITKVDATHIYFIDKKGDDYMFLKSDVKEISPMER